LHDLLALLSYYIETRYPGDYPEGYSWKMAEEALEAAMKVKNIALNEIS
jgi:HEPN domain-containing protein